MNPRRLSTWFVLLLVLTGCSTVGTGYRTVVRAPCEIDLSKVGQHHEGTEQSVDQLRDDLCRYLTRHYSHLVAPLGSTGDSLVLRIDPQGQPIESSRVKTGSWWLPTYDHFKKFLLEKYGSVDFSPADLSFTAHDRATAPAYTPQDPRAGWLSAITTIFTSGTLPLEERERLVRAMEGRLRNVPDLAPIAVLHHDENCKGECEKNFELCTDSCKRECGKSPDTPEACQAKCNRVCREPGPVFYYYPRVSVDFSSSFLSTSPMDRLSYLAMVIRLHGKDRKGLARFIDFRPKDAEIPTFSRGDLTQTGKVTLGADDVGPFALSVESGDSYVSHLMDAIEKKSTGILEDGRTFFVDLRSLREIRIAGSYNFDLMLEVPSRLKRGIAFESEPVEEKLVADVFLIGVVRHVHSRGRIGTFNRVPESENDQVYEQVVLRVLPEQELWTAPATPWAQAVDIEKPGPCKLQVLTNREDASFTVRTESGAAFDGGSGRKSSVDVPACGKVQLAFLPVITKDQVLVVEGDDLREVDFSKGQTQSIEGKYLPKARS